MYCTSFAIMPNTINIICRIFSTIIVNRAIKPAGVRWPFHSQVPTIYRHPIIICIYAAFLSQWFPLLSNNYNEQPASVMLNGGKHTHVDIYRTVNRTVDKLTCNYYTHLYITAHTYACTHTHARCDMCSIHARVRTDRQPYIYKYTCTCRCFSK